MFIYLLSPFLSCSEWVTDYFCYAFFKDFLEDLWDRIQVLSSNGWKVESGKFYLYANFSSVC